MVLESVTGRAGERPFNAVVSRSFPFLPAGFTGQSHSTHAGDSVLTGFMDALV